MTLEAVGADSVVRLNPRYQVRDGESWAASWPVPLRSFLGEQDGTAVLVAAPEEELPAKWISSAAAELLTILRRPGPPPSDLSPVLASALVLDAVLDVLTPDGWVNGPAAFEALWGDEPVLKPTGLGRVSVGAVSWAATLPVMDVVSVVGRLYAYGRYPLSQRWRRRYPGPTAVLDALGGAAAIKDWEIAGHQDAPRPWLSFARPRSRSAPSSHFPYKLYLSPHPDALSEVLPMVARELAATPATQFKLGGTVGGLLRPDKLVVYLRDVEELEETAGSLATALRGARPHGVPFSADLGGDGLLSWGADPPREATPVGDEAESWRLSVCRRLAEGLRAARRVLLTRTTPERFALTRLALDGVDLASFAPLNVRPPAPVGGS